MPSTDLKQVADRVLRRAQAQGFVVPREVRAELAAGGLDEAVWKEVLTLLRPPLRYRSGRYYYESPVSARMRARTAEEQRHKRAVHHAVRGLIRQYEALVVRRDRRSYGRVHFLHTVQVRTEDGRALNLFSRDISLSGIRLLGTEGLRGQRLRVRIPAWEPGVAPRTFLVQVLWSSEVADGLVQNGAVFLELLDDDSRPAPSDPP